MSAVTSLDKVAIFASQMPMVFQDEAQVSPPLKVQTMELIGGSAATRPPNTPSRWIQFHGRSAIPREPREIIGVCPRWIPACELSYTPGNPGFFSVQGGDDGNRGGCGRTPELAFGSYLADLVVRGDRDIFISLRNHSVHDPDILPRAFAALKTFETLHPELYINATAPQMDDDAFVVQMDAYCAVCQSQYKAELQALIAAAPRREVML